MFSVLLFSASSARAQYAVTYTSDGAGISINGGDKSPYVSPWGDAPWAGGRGGGQTASSSGGPMLDAAHPPGRTTAARPNVTGTGGTIAAGGAITANVALPDGATAPDAVLVEEYCRVSWSGASGTTGGCTNPLGGSPIPDNNGGQVQTFVRYTFVASPGATLGSYTCAPSANASFPSGGWGGVYVEYRVAVYPITIAFATPTTKLADGTPVALTGMLIDSYVSGLPSGATNVHYQWTVGGDAFETYDTSAPNTQHTTQLVPLSAEDLSQSDLAFYDRKQETLSVGCTVTFDVTNGSQGITANPAPKSISILKPTTTWDIHEGFVQYAASQYTPNGNVKAYGLYSLDGNSPGMAWSNVVISVPDPFGATGGTGTFTQKVLPERYGYIGSTMSALDPFNGIFCLDGSFDYGAEWAVPTSGSDADGPAITVGPSNQPTNSGGYTELTANDTFTTWVMYMPSSSGSKWVPLKQFSWTWAATIDWQNSQWNLTSAFPATAASAPHYTPQPADDPPQWSSIHG